MRFQITIRDEENKTKFLSENGKFTKYGQTVDGNPLIFNYKTVKGMVKAAKKIMTEKSEVVAWNNDGSPKNDFKI